MRRTTKSINGMMSSWHCFSTSSLISVNQFPRCGAYIQAQCAIDLSKVTGRAAGLAAPVLCGPVADLINTSLLTSASAHPARPENFDTATGRRLSAHIYHAGALPRHRANCCPALCLSHIVVVYTLVTLRRSVRFQANGHCSAQHNHRSIVI